VDRRWTGIGRNVTELGQNGPGVIEKELKGVRLGWRRNCKVMTEATEMGGVASGGSRRLV
jgi:hypothetical protein